MKILKKIIVSLVSLLIFTGCTSTDINKERGTEYKYDFVDLMDVKLYGSEGYGFIEVRPKDISMNDPMFESEEEYIAVRKALDQLGLYVGPDKKVSSYLEVTPNSNLKNGDMVTFSFKSGFNGDLGGLSINLEPYNWIIQDSEGNGLLKEPKKFDLFNSDSVMFYGLKGTNLTYAKKLGANSIPEDVLNNIEYTSTVGTNEMEAGKTVIKVQAKLNDEFLTQGDNPAFDTQTYFGRMGYLVDLESEKVLQNIAEPIDVQNLTLDQKNKLTALILDYLNTQEITINNKTYTVDMIATLQQYNSANGSYDPYNFYVTFMGKYGNERTCIMTTLKIATLNGVYIIPERLGNFQSAGDSYCYNPMTSMNMIINNNVPMIDETNQENLDTQTNTETDSDNENVDQEIQINNEESQQIENNETGGNE